MKRVAIIYITGGHNGRITLIRTRITRKTAERPLPFHCRIIRTANRSIRCIGGFCTITNTYSYRKTPLSLHSVTITIGLLCSFTAIPYFRGIIFRTNAKIIKNSWCIISRIGLWTTEICYRSGANTHRIIGGITAINSLGIFTSRIAHIPCFNFANRGKGVCPCGYSIATNWV